jgi:hypothetical protein
VLVVTLNVIRRLAQAQRMLAAISVIGGFLALLALAQNLTDSTMIYWLIPIESNEATSGPFVNHSHFAQYMNMSMGAAMGLLLMYLDRLPRHRHHDSLRAAALARPITTPIWLLACAIVAMAVAVPLSLSRGGMVAMFVAGLFTVIVLATRRGMHGRTWIFVGLVVAMFAAILLLQWDSIFRRTRWADA